MKVAINGFGRMGRLALRIGRQSPTLEFVAVNEPNADPATAAHLLEFDSIHGRLDESPGFSDASLELESGSLEYTSRSAPSEIWSDLDVDAVLECSGQFRNRQTLEPFLESGAGTVVVSAPVRAGALNVVVGVNHALYEPSTHDIVTAASCTTNCLAPVVKVLHESIGIRHGSITTLHDVTNTQTIVDAPHSDLRRARAAGLSLIPTSTGSAAAIGLIFPELEGLLDGHAVRVPLLNASLTDCVFETARETAVDEVNGLLEAAAQGELAGILGFERRPLVSVDYRGDARSSIVDALSTRVTGGSQVKVYAWYDNEWGYANRLIDLLELVAERRAQA